MKRLVLLVPAVMALLGSCTADRGGDRLPAGEKEVEMSFSTAGVYARAEGTAQENAIKSVDLLVFDGRDLEPADATFLYNRYAWLKSGNTYAAVLKTGTELDIYVAVNAAELIATGAITEGMTWSEVRELLVLTRPDQIDLASDGLPMWGCVTDFDISDDRPTNSMGVVKLLRSVAAANVTITATNFSLAKGHIVYGADRGYLPYSHSNTTEPDAETGDFGVVEPEPPSAMVTGMEWSHTVTPGETAITNVFYLYENDAPADERPYTRLILEGRWNASSQAGNTFYPLSFRDRTTNDKLPIKRNTKYTLIITGVYGDGYPDIESAKQAEDVNMDFEVIPWNEYEDGEIMLDGNKFFYRAASVVHLRPLQGSRSEIVIRTNFDLSEIKMKFLPGELDYASEASNDRFTAAIVQVDPDGTPGSGDEYNCLRFTALKDYAEDADNPSTLHVMVGGRLSFTVTVTQMKGQPTNWSDGGDYEKEL